MKINTSLLLFGGTATAVATRTISPAAVNAGGSYHAITSTITPAPTPLLDSVCTSTYLHMESAATGVFLNPWVGCDAIRPQCCAPGYVPTAPENFRTAFRVPTCPLGFTALFPDPANITLPTGVSSVCCPPYMTALQSSGTDWDSIGVVCARTMEDGQKTDGLTAFLAASVTQTVDIPKRFKSRVMAIGYFMDPDSTLVVDGTPVETVVSGRYPSYDRVVRGMGTFAVTGIAVGVAVAVALLCYYNI